MPAVSPLPSIRITIEAALDVSNGDETCQKFKGGSARSLRGFMLYFTEELTISHIYNKPFRCM